MIKFQKFTKRYREISLRRILLYLISFFLNEMTFPLVLLFYNIVWLIYTITQTSPLLTARVFHALFALIYSLMLIIYVSEKQYLRYVPYLHFVSIVTLVFLYVSLLLPVPSTALIATVLIFLLFTLFLLLCDIECIKLTKQLFYPKKHRLIEIIKNQSKEKTSFVDIFVTNLKIFTHSPLVVNILIKTILVRFIPTLIPSILVITPIILFLIEEDTREHVLYHIRVTELLLQSFLILTLLLAVTGLKYAYGAVIKYWFLKLDLLPRNIAKKLDYLRSHSEKTKFNHIDLDLAMFKFNKFQNDVESIDLRSAYLDLMIALEALGVWNNVSKSDCCERARRVFERKGIDIEQTLYPYGLTHSELRGALVHGSLKKGRKSKSIRERELLFNIDPICPIIDLLVALDVFVDQASSHKSLSNSAEGAF